MVWFLRALFILPALIVAVLSSDVLGPATTLVAVILIIGFGTAAAGWTIGRNIDAASDPSKKDKTKGGRDALV